VPLASLDVAAPPGWLTALPAAGAGVQAHAREFVGGGWVGALPTMTAGDWLRPDARVLVGIAALVVSFAVLGFVSGHRDRRPPSPG
jgi:hypothetical protein